MKHFKVLIMMLVALVIFASNTYAQDKNDIEVFASCKDGNVIATVSTSNSKLTLTMVIDGNKLVTCSADTIVKIYESKFKIGGNFFSRFGINYFIVFGMARC